MRSLSFSVIPVVILLSIPALAQQPAANPELLPVDRQKLLDDLVRAKPGGMSADEIGKRASATSFNVQAQEAQLRVAAARVDEALSYFLPRVTGRAGYTRLSEITPPSLGSGGFNFVASNALPGTVPATSSLVVSPPLSFPVVLNNISFVAGIVVPISDYFLRINQNHTAATQSQTAAKVDLATVKAKAVSDGRIAYYTWMRARGAILIATLLLEDQRTHQRDIKNQLAVGSASQADFLRSETAIASAELSLLRAQQLTALTETQVRIAIHAKSTDAIIPGESIDTALPQFSGDLKTLVHEAEAQRLEFRSIDANITAARAQGKAQYATMLPSLGAFGNVYAQNPNQRIFPAREEFNTTWDVGVQLTWTPGDIWTGSAIKSGADARAEALEAQKKLLRDGIEVEVTQAYQACLEADGATLSGDKQLSSATEALRIARELFNAGRATATMLTDAETDLTRARLDVLNSRVDARIARVRLDHATGRDAKGIAVD